MLNWLKDILFVSYLKNKGVRRICFVVGLMLGVISFASEGVSIYPIVLFYMPFIIAVCIRWIYIGFSKNEEIIHAEKTSKGLWEEKLKRIFSVKRVINFFFSYDGRVNRLQYFGGLVLANFIFCAAFVLDERIGCVIYAIHLYVLLGLVQKRSRDMGEVGTKYIVAILLGNWAINIKAGLSENIMDVNSALGVIMSLLACAALGANICLLFGNGAENPDMNKRSKLTQKPVLLVIGMTMITFMSVLGLNYFNDNNDELEKAVFASSILYRHTVVYNSACEEYGVTLNNYPKAFEQKLEPEIKIIKNILQKNNMSIEGVYEYIHTNDHNEIRQAVNNELAELRKALILSIVSEEQKMPVDRIVWDNEFYKIVSLKDVCVFWDERMTDFIDKDNGGFTMIKQAMAPLAKFN